MPIARRLAATGVACMALLAAACAGDDDGAEPVAISSCSGLVYEGEGEPDGEIREGQAEDERQAPPLRAHRRRSPSTLSRNDDNTVWNPSAARKVPGITRRIVIA